MGINEWDLPSGNGNSCDNHVLTRFEVTSNAKNRAPKSTAGDGIIHGSFVLNVSVNGLVEGKIYRKP